VTAAVCLPLAASVCCDVLTLGLARVAAALGAVLPITAAVDLLSASGRASDFLLLPGCFKGDCLTLGVFVVAFGLLAVAFVMMLTALVKRSQAWLRTSTRDCKTK
jgi:glycine/D-amino acid oxidase-like deaminating enzyme